MKYTSKILEVLNVDNRIKLLYKGNVKIPYLEDNYTPFVKGRYEYPPMFTPLFADHGLPMLTGLVIHPFLKRKVIFAKFYLEADKILEIARNTNQILTLMVLEMDMVADGVSPEIEKFCTDVNYTNLKEVDDFAEEFGDIPEDFDKLIFLKNQTPLRFCKHLNDYDGDYISSENLLNRGNLEIASSYEVSNESLLLNIEELPEWLDLTGRNLKVLFNKYLKEESLDKAWLLLNNRGWKLNDIAEGLLKMKSLTNDYLFNLLADNWLHSYEGRI